jgi:hypothetical protein
MGGIKKQIKEPNNRIIEADSKLQEACEELRDYVDHINKQPAIMLKGLVYRGRDIKAINTIKVDGVEIGYRIKEFETFIRRQVFIKVPGYRIKDITKAQRSKILTAVFNVFIVIGASVPRISVIAPDCFLFEQDIILMVLRERSPGLVSIAGGM